MNTNLQALYEKRAAAYAAMKDLRHQLGDDGKFDSDGEAAWAKHDADYRSLTDQIKREEAWVETVREQADREYEARQRTTFNTSTTAAGPDAYATAFGKYLRMGERNLDPDDLRTLREKRGTSTQVTGTDSLGGYAVPTGFSGQIEKIMKYYGPMLQLGRELPTASGNPFEWPTIDDTAVSGSQKTEASGQVAVSDMTLGIVTFNCYTATSEMVKASRELIQDDAGGFISMLPDLLGDRLGRHLNTRLTTGSGSSQAQGAVTAAAAGKVTASTTAFTKLELIDLVHSVDRAYRFGPNVAVMMNDTIMAAARKLDVGNTDTVQLLTQPLISGEPYQLLGYPIFVNNDMASTQAANAKIMVFGDFSKFIIRRVGGINLERVESLYQDYLNVGFFVWTRYDSRLIASGALKYLANAAS